MELDKNFREFIALLNAHKIRYLIVGGYAVNFHGYPRYTGDIDFWIDPEKNNVQKLILLLKDFGMGALQLSEEDFYDEDNVIQLGYPPNRIDLLTDISGADFDSCYQQREVLRIDDLMLNFLALGDLIQVKRQTGRLQDLADAEELEKIAKRKK